VARWLPAPRNDGDAGAAGLGLDFIEKLLVGHTAFMKRRRSRGVSLENALDDEAVEVHLRIEQRAKAMDEGERAGPGTGACRRAGVAQGLVHNAQENAQRQRLDRPIMFEVIAQPLGNRQHPLTDRQSRKNVVGQVGGGFDHPPGVAGGTDTTAFARMHA